MTEPHVASRRALLGIAATATALAADVARAQTPPQPSPGPGTTPGARPLRIAMLVYPDMILLDLVGPQTIFNLLGAEIHLVAAERTALRTDVGVLLQPTTRFEDCPSELDVLFVPGGLAGSIQAMGDATTLAFLAGRGATARFVTSVCTGALVLAAAGLLRGYRATSHWYVRDLLPRMGAIAVPERVVVDRNRVTGGGVTAGLDFGLTLAALLRKQEDARRIQLVLEYDPHPPFDAGSPQGAGTVLTADVLRRRAPALTAAIAAVDQAAARLAAK